jgi:predicted regulator of Ras-like GTPase activity (Roadblock/LC7/MglB family)
MDAAQALEDLTQVSTQIEGAVLAEPGGKVVASTYGDEKAGRVASAALSLLEEATSARADGAELTQVLAELDDGAVFVVRSGSHLVAAVTKPDPIAGLIFYDLKTCLRLLEEKPDTAKRAGSKRKKAETKADGA